ncbi:hypothetical protein SELMODRAFT_443789 [Selaginella moellendorffii]|uniref:Uncharacterized protein n=2 Tax=Selaginella moellendorffii TaxID=88036 RepID=D8S4G3_SELML|nr:hypothetical protein SELMODRAFT_443789 [Selaginella moellendorffii]
MCWISSFNQYFSSVRMILDGRMVIPVSARPNIWNSTLPAQETELADQEVDRTTTLFSYDEGQYLSEDEDGAKEQARKDTLKLQEEAMRCAQSLEDTEGLEEVAMFSDKMLSYGSGFGSFRSAPGDHFLASSNGTQADEAEEERLVSASSATSPAWYRGDLSSHCGRGCCGSPWQTYTPTRSLLGGVEYVEEELLSAKKPWRGSSASQSSRDLVSASAVQSLLVAKLKQRSGMGGGGGSSDSGTSVSSIVQEILAREISEQTAIVLQALEQAQHSSF